jgi:hypothetical protein
MNFRRMTQRANSRATRTANQRAQLTWNLRKGAGDRGRETAGGRPPGASDFTHTDPWRVLRIQSEFVEGFDALAALALP